ncbi:unnamed protein product [Thelazia callipaeda]|uniref:Ribonuclease T(2) n=1 Tax=Thelazia callipaeda TaxID=103827 RepID=A0A0N5CPX9_THECL|nr:unnamed protein product [Thelazia callipaeda]
MKLLILLSIISGDNCYDAKAHNNSSTFDYFIFTIIYPTSAYSAAGPDCEVPKQASLWVIHGLWLVDNSYPQYCDREKKFDIKKVECIKAQLEISWPNLFTHKSVSSLWEHEWEKHGTCAVSVDRVNEEVKYFNESLKLLQTLDIAALVASVYSLLHSDPFSTSIFSVNILCFTSLLFDISSTSNKWYLGDVRFCFTKTFSLMDCGKQHRSSDSNDPSSFSSYETCPAASIMYLPMQQSSSNLLHSYSALSLISTTLLLVVTSHLNDLVFPPFNTFQLCYFF